MFLYPPSSILFNAILGLLALASPFLLQLGMGLEFGRQILRLPLDLL